MTSVSKRTFGFTSASLYRRREPHVFTYLSERATFWIAVLSIFAFVTGNMVGQHGWHVFWKSVLGEGTESTIAFTGMVPPIPRVPDYERWARLGGSVRTHTFRQVPVDLLVPLPRYVRHGDDVASDTHLRNVYFVEHLGTYATGRGKGSHVGEDISVPEGTPVVSIANGIVTRVGNDPGGYGNFVVVKHPNVPDVEERGVKSAVYSGYAHLSSALVAEGTVVQKGEKIALSGRTGNVTAPHLHFQMDKESAPYHPYWLFSGAEQKKAGLTFAQAIDQGLNRDRGVQYTLDPMLTVQAYDTFVGPVVANASVVSSASSISVPVRTRPLTIAERRTQRLTKATPLPTLVAYTENVPVIPIPVASSSVHSAASVTGVGAVASIRISHDGSFTRDRAWKTLTLTLLDAEGRVVTVPKENKKITLATAFGQAEFKRTTFSLTDFKKGVFQTEILPLGQTTVVVQAKPYDSMSEKPMKAPRN